MRLTIATKIYACVVGVILLAILSSAVALFSSWHTQRLLNVTFHQSITSIVASQELDVSVLEQRGFVSAYLLDNADPKWLERLSKRKKNFDQWFETASEVARTADERRILADLREVYIECDLKRREVVRLFDGGEKQAARRLLLDEVNVLYDRAYDLCEDFIRANEERVNAARDQAQRRVHWVIASVACCVMLTIGFGAALVWLFFRGVMLPVRALVAEAQEFTGDGRSKDRGLPTDELRAVGVYLRHLMSDVADARSTLERSRRELKAAEQLASVGRLAASVAHEIRNPLTSLKMWLYSIQKEVDGDEALNRKFAIVSGEVKRLENVVRHFLEFSRPREPRLQPESLVSLVDQIVALLQPRIAGRGIRLERVDAPDLPCVMADGEQLKQVLLNVLTNAVDAVDERGEIRVASVREAASAAQPMVAVRIIDNGPGMSDEVKRRIFEPFFTTKKDDGTGLGLAISARIMAQHQGRLMLESTGPSGTIFTILIPSATGV